MLSQYKHAQSIIEFTDAAQNAGEICERETFLLEGSRKNRQGYKKTIRGAGILQDKT